ncbi:MAG: peptide chain release factor 1 [Acidobacteria bacterium]|nr:MAG: peptide chain release factor 1 [Acidobacteriota bacterium]
MEQKLEAVEKRFIEVTAELGKPEVVSDHAQIQSLAKLRAELEPVVNQYRDLKSTKSQLQETREMLAEADEDELKALAQEEVSRLEQEHARLMEELRINLLPKDPNDERNVLLEIRAGTGGEEAALFAQEMFRMYSQYAEQQHWKVQVMSVNETGIGGIKEVVALIEGKGAYSRLKYESGVHRVQRVPATEASGRIHTSAVTVAVLPEAEDIEVDINPNDVRTDTYCSSGPGGQSVNTTYSAVRLTHKPTGLVVTCQDEKSQIKNKAKAMRVLRSRLYDLARKEQQDQIASERKGQIGSGDRSEKIRTYNFREARVTDHRIHFTLHQLTSILNGNLDTMIDALVTHYQTEKLREAEATV